MPRVRNCGTETVREIKKHEAQLLFFRNSPTKAFLKCITEIDFNLPRLSLFWSMFQIHGKDRSPAMLLSQAFWVRPEWQSLGLRRRAWLTMVGSHWNLHSSQGDSERLDPFSLQVVHSSESIRERQGCETQPWWRKMTRVGVTAERHCGCLQVQSALGSLFPVYLRFSLSSGS